MARRTILFFSLKMLKVIRMINVNTGDNVQSFQLKECYDLAARFEKFDTARDILREKSKRIKNSKKYVSVQKGLLDGETEMQIISEAIYELTLEGLVGSKNTRFHCIYKIENLPNSAEKEYILALLDLRSGTDETHRLSALRHISAALSHSPNDPRYITLASILQDVDK